MKSTICVDLGPSEGSGARRIEIRKIIQLLDEHRIAATWAVEDARALSYVAPLLEGPIRHQAALKIVPAWGGGDSTHPSLFQKQLESRLAPFQKTGIPVRTALVPPIRKMHSQFGPMARHGLTTLVVGAGARQPPTRMNRRSAAPHKLPRGLWQFPANLFLPSRHPWFARFGSHRLPAIHWNEPDATSIHVLISASQVVAHPGPAFRQLGRFLNEIAWAESRCRLQVVTAITWADEMARRTIAPPQRSILRIAA